MANRNYPKNVTATTVIPFDNPVTHIPPKTVTGPITFTKTTTGAQAGYCSIIRVVADGTNAPDLSAFKSIGTGTYDNTNGVVNQLWFVFDGVDYCVAITHPVAISGGGGGGDTTPPTLVSGNATDSTHVTLVFSETVVPTVVGWSIYNGTSTFSFASVSGSGTTWAFVVGGGGSLAAGETLTVAYNPTTGNTLDTAGNELGSISSQSITNSIGGGSYEAESIAYFTAESITNTTDKNNIDTLIVKALKNATVSGSPVNLFAKFKRLSLYFGTTHEYNIVNTSNYQASFGGGYVHDASGSTNSNTVEISGFTPSTNATEGEGTYGVIVGGAGIDATERYFFGTQEGAVYTRFGWQLDSGTEYIFTSVDGASATITASAGTRTTGHYAVTGSGGNLTTYFNGSPIDTRSAASTGRSSNVMYFGGRNNDGGAGNYYNGTYKLSYIADALTDAEMSVVHSIFSTFLTAIGR